jgi:uncharacterized membrane protein (UPF0127 family)
MDTPTPLVIRRAEGYFARLRGLLFAPPLAPGQGLMLTPCKAVHTFFMRTPIDVVFIDREGVIRKIVAALAPWRAASCRGAHHALELASGEAARQGLEPGRTLPGLRQASSAPQQDASPASPPPRPTRPRASAPLSRPQGATLAEFVVVVPTLLFLLMNLLQYGLLYHTKSQLNYAAFEAARAGTVANAHPGAIRSAFERAMTGYHGGGTTTAELAASYARAQAESSFARIEILSPTRESFDDYHSPALATRLGLSSRVLPNTNIAFLECPNDRPGCARDPATNASGQSLADANLLKLRITYGIPPAKQIPLAGPFMARALAYLNPSDADGFRAALVTQGRIPVVTHTVMRMHSPPIENPLMASIPGPGNAGTPTDPGPEPEHPDLPRCPVTDPTCLTQPAPGPTPGPTPCNPLTDPMGCRPIGCRAGDPACDPACKQACCTLPSPPIRLLP